MVGSRDRGNDVPGVYLDDLKVTKTGLSSNVQRSFSNGLLLFVPLQDDEEMISLYVGSSRRGLDVAHPNSLATAAGGTGLIPNPNVIGTIHDEEDAESGKGPSLPMSPHSVDGAIGGRSVKPPGYPESSDDEMKQQSGGNIAGTLK